MSSVTEDTTKFHFPRESISFRRSLGCNRKAPGYLDSCRECAAALGDPFGEEILIISPTNAKDRSVLMPESIRPVAALALELSGPRWL
jgi:hypothetical protein